MVHHHRHHQQQQPLVKVEFYDDNNGSVVSVEVPEHTLITEAAAKAGVTIPQLCHHPRLKPVGRCGLCVVSVEDGPSTTQLACSTYCKKKILDDDEEEDKPLVLKGGNKNDYDDDDDVDMRVHVNGTDLNGMANAALRRNMEHAMIYREFHEKSSQYAACGTLEIEDLGNFLKQSNLDTSSAAIIYDPSLCVGCSRCVRACSDQLQGMNILDLPIPVHAECQPTMGIAHPPPCMTTKAGRQLKDTDCISCGQCTLFCPTGAIKEVDHTARVMRALSDPEMVVVLQTAPSARVTISEMFGSPPGECSEKRLVGAAKACGFQYVFDTLVAADLTVVEEAHELLKRIEIANHGSPEKKKKMPLPMFTSCCPGWINLVEQSYPELIPHLSTCRSPMAMMSSLIRYHWWPKLHIQQQRQTKTKISFLHNHLWRSNKQQQQHGDAMDGFDQSKLYVVAVMPCTAKKDEIARKQLRMPNGKPETDAALTVREFARLMELRGVAQRNDYNSFQRIPEAEYDNPFGDSTGAAAIFGVTGGVMEAALRTAVDFISGEDLKDVKFEDVRGLKGIKTSKVRLSDSIALNVAACHQMGNVRQFLKEIKDENKKYHFIEVMACPGGCIGGGGLPQSRDDAILAKRMSSIYSIDERKVKRKSHKNPEIVQLYDNVLGKPLSRVCHKFLHTKYFARPRKPIPLRKAPRRSSIDLSSSADRNDTITILYGSQGGTSKHAAHEIKVELKKNVERSTILHINNVVLLPGDIAAPEKLVQKVRGSFLSIFVTPTYDGGDDTCFPQQLQEFWECLLTCEEGTFDSMRYAVFGLGSTMYSSFEENLFNRAGKLLDAKLEELGGERFIPLGLGDDLDPKNYKTQLDRWTANLLAKLRNMYEEPTTCSTNAGSVPSSVCTTELIMSESKLTVIEEPSNAACN